MFFYSVFLYIICKNNFEIGSNMFCVYRKNIKSCSEILQMLRLGSFGLKCKEDYLPHFYSCLSDDNDVFGF